MSQQQQQFIREQAQVEYLVFDEQAEPRIQSALARATPAATPVAVRATPAVVQVQEPVQEVVQVAETPVQFVQEAPVEYIEEAQYVQEAPVQYVEQVVAEPTQYIEEVAAPVEVVQENIVVADSGCAQQEAVVVAAAAVASPAPCAQQQVQADIIAQAEAQFAKSSACASLADLPPLPPVNNSCWAPPPVAPGVTTCQKVQLPTEERVVETNDCDLQTVIRENNNYTTYNKTELLTVNRNHHHKTQIVENQVDHQTVVTNNIVKVNDIHRQQVEVVPGAKRVKSDARETVTVEPAKCFRVGVNGTPYPC